MLINLSNHPSINWEQSQIEAAVRDYGDIIDISFPHIDPQWDTEKINELAKDYYNKILLELTNHAGLNNAVHLMGETVFCFVLANMLKKAGILCLASTTIRNVKEKSGVKTSLFEFVRYRKYY